MFRERDLAWAGMLILVLGTVGCNKDFHRVRSALDGQQISDAERAGRTALLVLPGLLAGNSGRRDLRDWLATLPFDVFLPELDCEDGIHACARALGQYIEEKHLDEYGRLYAFTFILGGWTLNEYLAHHSLPNLRRVIYDRSPIQERGTRVVLEVFGSPVTWLYGDVVADLRDTPYLPIPKGDREIGIVIEGKAIWFMRWQKERVLASGPLEWDPRALGQEHDDHLYVDIDHDELYSSMDAIEGEILYFFEHGHFSEAARRKPFPGDPLE